MSKEMNTIDDFLKDRSNNFGGGGGKYLRGWKDNKKIRVWLHTKAPIVKLWRHGGIPRVVSFTDRNTDEQVTKLYPGFWSCFAGETRFWANGELIAFKDAVGETVEVLAGDGTWRPAQVKSFGEQSLRRIVFTPVISGASNIRYEYVATPNHRWITSNRGEVTDLRPGDRVLVSPRSHSLDGPEYKLGFVHGLFFGDGWREAVTKDGFQIRLYGEKIKHLPTIESYPGHATTSYSPSQHGDPDVRVRSRIDLKRVPPEESSLTYQAGFLMGWMAMDGHRDLRTASRGLSSINNEALNWVQERAPMLGACMTGRSVGSNMETNMGKRSAPLQQVALRFEPLEFKVKEIVDEGRVEEVFCVVEPATRLFTLEGGIVTGNCHEKEDVLAKQYKRNRETGEREAYPKACPICRLIETVHGMVDAGQLSITKPIFKFETDDPNAKVGRLVLHAGGLYNAFGRKDLGDDIVAEMRKANISLKEAWRENAQAKSAYLFCVVDHDAPDNGVQIAIEGAALGDAIRDVIDGACESLGREDGDPRRNPYAIMWKHIPEAKAFGDQYRALRLEKLEPTEEVLELIRGEAPDVSRDIKPFNIQQMRGMLEKHALVKLPWDEIFDVPGAGEKAAEGDEEEGERPKSRTPRPAARKPPESVRDMAAQARAKKPKPPKEDEVECDVCGKPMPESAPECPHCGEKYGLDAEDEAAPLPAVKQTPKASPPKKAPPPAPSESFFNDEDDTDGVGF